MAEKVISIEQYCIIPIGIRLKLFPSIQNVDSKCIIIINMNKLVEKAK